MNSVDDLQKLIDMAVQNRSHPEHELIKNLKEFRAAKYLKSGLTKVILNFKVMKQQIYKAYCEQLLAGKSDINLLAGIRDFTICINYYQEELDRILYLMLEYKQYIMLGHFIDSVIFGRDRPDEDMIDYLSIYNKD